MSISLQPRLSIRKDKQNLSREQAPLSTNSSLPLLNQTKIQDALQFSSRLSFSEASQKKLDTLLTQYNQELLHKGQTINNNAPKQTLRFGAGPTIATPNTSEPIEASTSNEANPAELHAPNDAQQAAELIHNPFQASTPAQPTPPSPTAQAVNIQAQQYTVDLLQEFVSILGREEQSPQNIVVAGGQVISKLAATTEKYKAVKKTIEEQLQKTRQAQGESAMALQNFKQKENTQGQKVVTQYDITKKLEDERKTSGYDYVNERQKLNQFKHNLMKVEQDIKATQKKLNDYQIEISQLATEELNIRDLINMNDEALTKIQALQARSDRSARLSGQQNAYQDLTQLIAALNMHLENNPGERFTELNSYGNQGGAAQTANEIIEDIESLRARFSNGNNQSNSNIPSSSNSQ